MKLFLAFLISLAYSSGPEEFLRGFLSGFQGTEVILGGSCLDESWTSRVEVDLDHILSGLADRNYLQAYSALEDLLGALVSELNDCHLPDLVHIYASLKKVPHRTKAFRFFANYPAVMAELEEADSKNPFVCGYHVGRALTYLEKEDSSLPNINGQAAGLVVGGFFNALVPHSAPCAGLLKTMSDNIKQLFEFVNEYLRGNAETMAAIEFEIMIIASNVIHIKDKCDADLPGRIYKAFFTKEGVIASYIKFGMNLEQINQIKQEAFLDIWGEKFEEGGEAFGKIFNIIIK